jgi:hypothetical protein
MEIRIKTAKEFHDSHVTIEIVADDQAQAAQVGDALRLDGFRKRREELEQQVQLQSERIAELQGVVLREVDARMTESDRADENWARFQDFELRAGEAEIKVSQLQQHLTEIAEAVNIEPIDNALKVNEDPANFAYFLAGAVQKVRDLLQLAEI